MPILDIQRQLRELGRIRTGQQVPSGNGRRRPAKLDHFRLTTASRELIDAAATAYGGTVQPWDSPAGRQWELITGADALDIVVPPGQVISQWWELWAGGGCQRRCDGRTEVLTDQPCLCPADQAERRDLAANGGACKPTTRLNVILLALPDIGVWRLESHGFYAAMELGGTAEVLQMASAAGDPIRARLRLQQREKKVPGKPVNRYAVPVLELPETRIVDLLPGGSGQAALPAPVDRRERVARPTLPAGPPPPTETAFRTGHGPRSGLPPSPPSDPVTGEVIEARPAGTAPGPTAAPPPPATRPVHDSRPAGGSAGEPAAGRGSPGGRPSRTSDQANGRLCGAEPEPGPMGLTQPCNRPLGHMDFHASGEGSW